MKPLNDMLPEETSKEYESLLALLNHTARKPALLAPDEQEQAIARVQERLKLFEEQTPQSEDIETQEGEPLPTPEQQQRRQRTPVHHGRILRFVNTLAAVLVIGAIIGISLLLFRHQPQTTRGSSSQVVSIPGASVGSPTGQGYQPGTVYVSRGGLEATLRVMPGPYFLSELLAVDITLTNHSHTTYQLQGVPVSNPCDQALGVNYTTTGANTAHYTFPMYGAMSCPFTMSQFKPGQTIAIRQYIPLTDSGHILLSEEARFLFTKNVPNQGMTTTDGPSPLDGHWPSLHITVASHVLSDRILTLHRTGSKVFVNAPVAARSKLLYLYSVDCMDFHDSGSTASGNYSWTPVTTTIAEPGCPGKNTQWTYAVSAPGYAIVSGSYTS